jgi:hypothetical protein
VSDDMRDAFDKLARRGTPRGFDHVLAGAAASAAAAAASGTGEGGAGVGDLEPIPFVTSEPNKGARRPFHSMITAAGVAALLLVSALAVSAVVGSGGSDSPEGAVRKFADALSHEDPLAAADVLAPDEVRSLHATLDAAARKAAELRLVQTAGAPLAGVDLNVSGLHLSTQSLGDGYAKVTVEGGTFTAATNKAKFSALMQKALRNTDDNTAESNLAQLVGSHRLPTFVVVVRRGGNWYLSAAYTALEYVREWNELPAADFGSGVHDVATLGADSPDAAVQDSMRALQANDWTKLMSMVSPTEIPVYDYRAALAELIRKNKAETGTPSTNFTIDAMTTKSDVNGDTAKVALSASGKSDSGKWSVVGGCFTPPEQTVAITCGGDGAFIGVIPTAFTGVSQTSQITVVKQDGRWFVSPVGTVLDELDHFLASIDPRALFTLIGIPNQLPPDGALTLGKPFELNATNKYLQILSFDGHKGQTLLGFAKSTSPSATPDQFSFGATVRLYAPDGSELFDADGLLYGQSVDLPADGKYTFAVQAFGRDDVRVTIWNAADAPPEAKQNNGIGDCTGTASSSTCISSGSGVAGTNGQLGLNGFPAFCDETGHARIDANGQAFGPDGKPLLDAVGEAVTFPAGVDLNGMCSDLKATGQNGGGEIVSGSESVGTTAVGPAVTVLVPTTPG